MANWQRLRTKDDFLAAPPELKLWRAVLRLAAEDAVKDKFKNMDGRNAIDAARSWFLNPTSNFFMVCNYAEYEPEYVLDKMKLAIERQERREDAQRKSYM